MQLHRNAKLGLSGRLALVRAIEAGSSVREAARCHGVSPATACTWSRRWREATPVERESLACLHDRSSRPLRCPRSLALAEQERICAARRRTGWGPRLLAGELGHPHSTVSKTLKRHGCSRQERPQREPANRYEWPCPGDLLHMDSTSTRVSSGRATLSPVTAARPAPNCAPSLAANTRTRSSTTTRGSLTPSCCRTSAPSPSPPSPNGRLPSPPATGSRRSA